MPEFLGTMAESSAVRARSVREKAQAAELDSRARSAPPVVPLDVTSPGFDLIAEVKLASPADGPLVGDGYPVDAATSLARAYADAGAAAISVLTEPTRFAGSLQHLEAVAAQVEMPVMRKDFLVDPIQVVEARAAGASGVLLIARLCSPRLLAEMTRTAQDLGMFVLVEVFDQKDIEMAAAVFDRDVLVGVNARNLATLQVEPARLATLAPLLPTHLPKVAESGIGSPKDAAAAARLGYRMALVGTSLVTSTNPAAAARQLLDGGRKALAEIPS